MSRRRLHATETLTPKCLAGVWPRLSLRNRTEQITAVRCVAFQLVFFLKGAAKLGGGIRIWEGGICCAGCWKDCSGH